MTKKTMKQPPKTVFLDLDGCLLDDGWRLDLIPVGANSKDDYHNYHKGIPCDAIIEHTKRAIQAHMDAGDDIYVVTARPSYTTFATQQKIKSDFINLHNYSYGLIMRPSILEGMPSHELKKYLTASLIAESRAKGLKIVAYDDRPDVLNMYRCEGVDETFLCNRDGCEKYELKWAHVTDVGIRGRHIGGNLKFSSDLKLNDGLAWAAFDEAKGFDTTGYMAINLTPNSNIEEFLKSLAMEPAPKEIRMGTAPLFTPVEETPQDTTSKRVDDILQECLDTYRAKSAEYGKDAHFITGELMSVLFPNGITLNNSGDFAMMHMFGHVVGKLTRFASCGLKHQDSIRDLIVYATFCETLIGAHDVQLGEPSED